MNSVNFLFKNKIEWEEVGEGVRRQIMGYDDKLMTVKVEFQTGAIGSLHAHPHSQTTYVASGIFEFEIDSVKRIVKTGDGLYMAPDVIHGVVCLESGTLIDSFSPAREDFLK
ncbi:MAG TPA: cupin domain-containing protein [Paludibacter sp.]|nr:cupin domain-containing protein [Paludibacter sp.]